MPTRSPNADLALRIEQAGWTNGEFARAVNRVGREMGLELRYDESSVWHWLRGTRPRAGARAAAREALSRRMGRPVNEADIGMASVEDSSESVDLGLTVVDDPVETLGRLGRADIDRRRFLTTAAYSTAGAALPLGAAGEAAARTDRARAGGLAGAGEVDAVRHMVAAFTAIDERHGGRHGRSAVVQYLTHEVADLCRARFATEPQHRQMLSAAASLTYLVGWKAYDAGEMGLAQRYYLQAYSLTREAEDPAHQAYILRILAHHGMDNDRPEHVLGLADEALNRARGRVDQQTESLFVICRARALAASGADRHRDALAEAERARTMASATGDEVEGWAQMWGAAAATVDSHTAKIMAKVGDHRAAERHHARARRRYAGTEHQRIAALSAAEEGRAQADQGQIEAACATWTAALDSMRGIRSRRIVKAVKGMRTEINAARVRGSRAARVLDERTRLYLAASSDGPR
ncbi:MULTISPECIES: hypothetical protein [unclassified Streptomyces]|uniref:hypothetical protein n=1 Tax=unclassified Streptomyces TaxID=2593676 RepID=UPI000823DFFA|nr:MULTISPECIES: hypothetical protein [unclassified Streptomyces]SCK61991.1 hypothetical protein YW7DRAFT_06472 [Streptomyces sp. AmelKG-E11A]